MKINPYLNLSDNEIVRVFRISTMCYLWVLYLVYLPDSIIELVKLLVTHTLND